MHHTAAKYLQPACMFTNIATSAFTQHATDIHFSTWFCKWKIRRTETDLNIAAIHFFCKEVKCLFKISERNILIDVQSFHLVKETMASCTYGFISIDTARTNNADGQFAFLHFT